MSNHASALTPLSFLERAAVGGPAKVACHVDGRTLTYTDLLDRAGRLTALLRAAGIGAGDTVAMLSNNRLATLDAHFGVPGSGAALVPLNTRLAAEEIAFIVGDCGPRLVIAESALVPLLPPGIPTLVADEDYEARLEAFAPVGLLDGVAREDQTISINYTSGTTGRPKGAVYTHRGAFLQALTACRAIALDDDSAFLWTLPMFHCNGWTYPWAVTAATARHVLVPRVEPAEIWPVLTAGEVTHYCCAPTVQIALMADERAVALPHPVTVAMGGAPPSPALIAQMRALGFDAMHLYGLTETYGPKTGIRARGDLLDGVPESEQAALLARQGHPISPCDEVRVVDAQGREVAADGASMGEVVIRGETVTPGYFANPQATADALRDGWLQTGDLAVRHADGTIELRDRSKDVIISGGENISSIEVEQALMAHPSVLEAAVVAMPHEHWGERPKAFVTLRSGASCTSDELLTFCREHLARFKCPDAVEFAELPKTATGKIRKRELRERGWAGRPTRVN
jgi:fatty-acyl-CoA synthase